MDNIYEANKDEIKEKLKVLWDYMKLNQPLEKCDLIMGCGCENLDIPVKCATLLKEGYAPKILFAGGLGKLTEGNFRKLKLKYIRILLSSRELMKKIY